MWIAEISESSNFWTQIALLGPPGSMPVWVSRTPMLGNPDSGSAGNEPKREQLEVRDAFNGELRSEDQPFDCTALEWQNIISRAVERAIEAWTVGAELASAKESGTLAFLFVL